MLRVAEAIVVGVVSCRWLLLCSRCLSGRSGDVGNGGGGGGEKTTWKGVPRVAHPALPAPRWIAQVEPALGSTLRPSFGFVRIQLLQYFFYYVPFHAWALWGSAAPPSPTLTAWAVVVAGGYAQAQVTCIGAAIFQ